MIARITIIALLVHMILAGNAVAAEAGHADLAKKLANPVAALISAPIQLNYDDDIGPGDDGTRLTINIQPVIPMDYSESLNLISRTILPVVSQDDVFPGAGSQSGLGDVVQSFFFSPKAPNRSGWIWGAGPVFLLPTGSDDLLSAEKWGTGPTGVALKQQGPWTYGALANHIWSFAGDDDRADVSSTFLQPFVNYTTPTAWSFILNMESTYDWKNDEWTVPVNAVVTKVTRVGGQLVSVGGGLRYWADSPPGGPEGLGYRLIVTLLFPR